MNGKTIPRKIILVPANLNKIQNLYHNNLECRTFFWLYLSKDALLFKNLRTSVPKDLPIIKTGDLLQDIAHRYRQDYIDFIGSLSVRNNSIYWWLTSVSEKNPFISTVFLYFCYLKIIEHFINSSDNLVIICDSHSLIDAIKDTFASRSDLTFIVMDSRFNRRICTSSKLFSGIVKKGYFLIRFISRIGIAKFFSIIKGHRNTWKNQNKIAIHSWTDARSFLNKGKYHDTYFGNMSDHVKEYSPEYLTISYVLPTIYYVKAVINLIRCNEKIFLFEEFLSFGDVFRALFLIQVKFPSIIDAPKLKKIDLSSVIREECNYDRFGSSRSETTLFHYFAGKRIAHHKNVKTLIYTFENHIWEKMLCLGIKESDTNCQLIGYAHSVVSPMYMFYTQSSFERDIAPMPDYILVNGKLAKERLTEAGFKKEKIIIGGAYRYGNLNNVDIDHHIARSRKSILVIPTSGLDETIELIDKIVSTFGERKDITVRIKPHPTVSAEKIIAFFPELPPHFSFTLDPVEILLKTTDLVIFTESTVSIEALARHIPVLHIKSDLRIDMNLFAGIEPIQSVAKNEEIERITLDLLMDSSIFDDRYDEIVGAFFAPVDNQIIKQIIEHRSMDHSKNP
jgi:hypothetical protein